MKEDGNEATMIFFSLILFLFIALVGGIGLGTYVLLLRKRLAETEQKLTQAYLEKQYLQALQEEKVRFLTMTQEKMEATLGTVCAQVLVKAQGSLVSLMDPLFSRFQESQRGHLTQHRESLQTLTTPLEKSLQSLQNQMTELEKTRIGAYETLREQVLHLSQGQRLLSTETNALVTALRTPHIRGCWGEMQLRRVVELAGMLSYCDFQEQPVFHGETEIVRPDLCIHLTGKKCILVDAKAPILQYLEASSAATTEEYRKRLQDHARLLKGHIVALSKKRYWSYVPESVEFTLLFLPGEAFLSAALEADASLLEFAAEKHIILATPVILIALLKTIAFGWRQEYLSHQTQTIISAGKEVYQYLEKLQTHLHSLGKQVTHASQSYHTLMTLMDQKILPKAQKLYSMNPSPNGELSDSEPSETSDKACS